MPLDEGFYIQALAAEIAGQALVKIVQDSGGAKLAGTGGKMFFQVAGGIFVGKQHIPQKLLPGVLFLIKAIYLLLPGSQLFQIGAWLLVNGGLEAGLLPLESFGIFLVFLIGCLHLSGFVQREPRCQRLPGSRRKFFRLAEGLIILLQNSFLSLEAGELVLAVFDDGLCLLVE